MDVNIVNNVEERENNLVVINNHIHKGLFQKTIKIRIQVRIKVDVVEIKEIINFHEKIFCLIVHIF